jgi:hypothetical protein
MGSEVVWLVCFLFFLSSLSAPLRGADDPLLGFTSHLSSWLDDLNDCVMLLSEISGLPAWSVWIDWMRSEVVWFLIIPFSLSAPLRGADDPLLAFTFLLLCWLDDLNDCVILLSEIGSLDRLDGK